MPELGFKTYTWPTSFNPQITRERLELERQTIAEIDFNREYNATFIDDQFSYLPSNLILNCTDDYSLNNEPNQTETQSGEYYVGIDFGKHQDHSAIAIVQKQPEQGHRLVYLKEFELETPYSAVIGTVRTLNVAYRFMGGCLDQTGVGEAPYEQIREFAPTIKGVTLTAHVKEDILGKLKLTMENQKLTIPRDQQRLLTQLTLQQCEPTADGNLKFTHPQGTNDDLLWSLALAVYASPQVDTRGLWEIRGARRR